jgi:N-acetylglutamate synthase-like GNAT family acetyltransferase
MKEYNISDDKSKLQLEVIHQYLANESYWAKNIPLSTVTKSIENSLCFGVYWNNKQIGFARVITDCATFAYLADVFVLEPHRGKGLSKKLMQYILQHTDLQGLRRFMLATQDAHSLYEQFGFIPVSNPQNIMEIKKENIY